MPRDQFTGPVIYCQPLYIRTHTHRHSQLKEPAMTCIDSSSRPGWNLKVFDNTFLSILYIFSFSFFLFHSPLSHYYDFSIPPNPRNPSPNKLFSFFCFQVRLLLLQFRRIYPSSSSLRSLAWMLLLSTLVWCSIFNTDLARGEVSFRINYQVDIVMSVWITISHKVFELRPPNLVTICLSSIHRSSFLKNLATPSYATIIQNSYYIIFCNYFTVFRSLV